SRDKKIEWVTHIAFPLTSTPASVSRGTPPFRLHITFRLSPFSTSSQGRRIAWTTLMVSVTCTQTHTHTHIHTHTHLHTCTQTHTHAHTHTHTHSHTHAHTHTHTH